MSETTVEKKCAYCHQPGALAYPVPSLNGAPDGVENHHEHCRELVTTLRQYQQLLYAVSALHHAPLDAMLERVLRKRFTGWLDIKLSSETRRVLIESTVRLRLRADTERPHPGWSSIRISPDIVTALQLGLAEASGIAPEHSDHVMDVDVSQQQPAPEVTS